MFDLMDYLGQQASVLPDVCVCLLGNLPFVEGARHTTKLADAWKTPKTKIQNHESLGFSCLPEKEAILEQVKKIRSKMITVKLGKAKLTLMKLIPNRSLNISDQDLMLLYNEINSGKVKSINRERIKQSFVTYR